MKADSKSSAVVPQRQCIRVLLVVLQSGMEPSWSVAPYAQLKAENLNAFTIFLQVEANSPSVQSLACYTDNVTQNDIGRLGGMNCAQ